MWKGDHSRRIVSRIVVEGDLVLQTPAHFGNGDGDDIVDMPLMLDPLDEAEGRITPLLTGASLAGALRSYLREVECGYGSAGNKAPLSIALFGGSQADDGEQSPLIVDDSRGTNGAIEFRDGVAINTQSRTAHDGKKYDLQLWAAGTCFPLRFELAIREYDDAEKLRQALVTALGGLSKNDGITLGMRKRRGYGAVTVADWRVREWNLKEPVELLDWLENGAVSITAQDSLENALGAALPTDARDSFTIEATFALDGSLLIRSEGRSADNGPDAVHLKARKADGVNVASVLSGTSLAGVLRARACKILKTLGDKDAKAHIDAIFGADMTDRPAQPWASRLNVTEQVISKVREDFVQNRVSIDRFTGGALDTALFNEQPVFGDKDSRLTMTLHLRQPEDAEIGLLLLLLKDLWTGDLTVGSESSVGRGRLQGISATLKRSGKTLGTINATGERLQQLQWSDRLAEQAESYLTALRMKLSKTDQEVAV
ncbi:MAG TPA: RAMP superfamily CRISPR-associated protein [Blastocatellia bacterium]|nr:RAMP superfamily CRISPR-associated protein [Blastocatellia bacterium]HMX29364.1 RAMP superfamily CRISPR-associated protein [Blastocatellia bacterium]HNG28326.1 RAMP superfamily CRISPR-associated protein [Blastocatellia bacterium]